jgi:hypothetical protein
MKKRSWIVTLFLGLAMSFTAMSCEDDDVEPGLGYESQGYIKGSITGVTSDGSYVLDEDFNYKNYSLLLNSISTYEMDGDVYEFSLSRADYDDFGAASISFELSAADDTTPDDVRVSINWAEERRNDIITFSMNSSSSGNSVSITDFSFNEDTGRVKGKYTMNGTNNSTDNNALVTGEFDVVAKPIIE